MPRIRVRAPYVQLSEFERGRIVGLREGGMSFRDIAERVGREPSTVHQCWTQWVEEGSHTRRPGTGPSRRTDERQDRRIRRMALATRSATSAQIRSVVTPHVTARTVRNRLLESGLRSRVPLQCLPLTPAHCRERLSWCRARADWTVEWRRVVFSDESRFCLGRSDRRVRVRRLPGERESPDCIMESHRSQTPGVMVWGAISYDMKSELVFFEGTVTARSYVENVVNPVVIPFLANINGAVFQQDNARPHTANITRMALQEVDVLPWPARSPDLSLIEHVWDMIGRRLRANPEPALTIPQLRAQVEQAWNDITQDEIRNLFDRMNNRVNACIRARGGHTRY